ncbi:MAG: DUF134 domain-containing protein [Candidatus Omnitrophota bacterium]|jgi:predicted DNA-binding protein (UPF0251 family)
MRPKKTRWIKCEPGERCFRPLCKPVNKLEGVYLTLDELEAIRLADFEKMEHLEAARRMRISRPTFSRILSSARSKVADGLVNIKAIKIEGGCCKILGRPS